MTPMTERYHERADAAGLDPRERGKIDGYLEGAEIAEAERVTILENPKDPSYTEHLAMVTSQLLAKCNRICYRAEQDKAKSGAGQGSPAPEPASDLPTVPTVSLKDAASSLATHLRDRDPHGRLVSCVAVGANSIMVMFVREPMAHEVQVPATWDGWPVETRVTGRMTLGTGEDDDQ